MLKDKRFIPRRGFLISAGAAVACTALPSNAGAARFGPPAPVQGIPAPPAVTNIMPRQLWLLKPPAPFTLTDFERNPFQRPMGTPKAEDGQATRVPAARSGSGVDEALKPSTEENPAQ